MRAIIADRKDGCSSLLVGDLNIAPLENDVWSHKQLLKIVSHTPIETETLEDLRIKGGWSDLMRHLIAADQKIYTWWSYRAKDWDAADRGRRLDHVWGSADLESHNKGLQVLRDARGWDRPSDHDAGDCDFRSGLRRSVAVCKPRRDLLDLADKLDKIAADMRMKRGGHFRVFFQNAPEDGAADADDFGFHIRHRAGETSGLGDERHFPNIAPGPTGRIVTRPSSPS